MESRSCNKEEDNHAQYAMQLASASVLPMALKAAIELGVLEIISEAESEAEAKLSPSQIASKLPTQNNPDAPLILDRVLRLLASHSILTCSRANQGGQVLRLYGLAPVAKYFLRNQDGGSLYPLFDLIQDRVILDMWYHLKDAVFEGGGGLPFERAYGMGAVEYVGKDAKFFEIFKAPMVDYNRLFMEELLKVYNGFEGLGSLVDVGGDNGSILHMIVSKYPTIKGINFDLPHIIEKASPNLGIEHVAGDMFASIPKGAAIFMKWILHGWDDDYCLKILKNCYEALPVDGKVIVVDLVIPEKPGVAARSLFQMDLFMMNMNANGKERTEREFQIFAKAAGFSYILVPFRAYNFFVVELYKNTGDQYIALQLRPPVVISAFLSS